MAAQQHTARREARGGGASKAPPEALLRRLVDAVYSAGHLGVTEEILVGDAAGYCTGTRTSYDGVGGVKAHATRLRSTFPGLTLDIKEVHQTADGFEASVIATGRFERQFGGIQPSCQIGAPGEEPGGPHVRIPGTVRGRTADGRFSKLEFDWDLTALRTQM